MDLKRTELIKMTGLNSSYSKKNKPNEKLKIEKLGEGALVPPDVFEALIRLDKQVSASKGTLFITELFRAWDIQAQARQDYENGIKKAYVSKPGESFHGGGRAVDISVNELNFKGIDKDKWIQVFWDICQPIGFKPIVKKPDISLSEVWHFDFPGKDWELAYNKISYTETAKCIILDCGKWNTAEVEEKIRKMFIQSQLIRLGYCEIGCVDGVFGKKTLNVLKVLGMENFDTKAVAIILSKREI